MVLLRVELTYEGIKVRLAMAQFQRFGRPATHDAQIVAVKLDTGGRV